MVSAAEDRPVAVVAALSEELRPLRHRLREAVAKQFGGYKVVTGRLGPAELALMVTGDGAQRARAGLAKLLDSREVGAVMAIGIAGGLSPDLEAGSLVLAGRVTNGTGTVPPPDPVMMTRARRLDGIKEGTVLSQAEIAIDPVAKERLWQESAKPTGLVVDLESASYARCAAERGIPYLVARVVSDSHNETLPLDFNRFRRPDGSIDRGRISRHVLLHPSLLPELMQLRERVQDCAVRLADFVEGVLAR